MVIVDFIFFSLGHVKSTDIDPRLIAPIFDIFFCCLPSKWRKILRCGVTVENLSTNDVLEKQNNFDKNENNDDYKQLSINTLSSKTSKTAYINEVIYRYESTV